MKILLFIICSLLTVDASFLNKASASNNSNSGMQSSKNAIPGTLGWIKRGSEIPRDFIGKLLQDRNRFMFANPSDLKNCEDLTEEIDSDSVSSLYQRAEAMIASQDFCGAAVIYKEIMRQYPVKPHWQQAWIRMIVSLIRAGDLIEAINEGSRFLNENKNSVNEENVSFLVLVATVKIVRPEATDRSRKFAKYFLGVETPPPGRDNGDNFSPTSESYLSFKSFLKAFPNTKYKEILDYFALKVRNRICLYEIEVADEYINGEKYYAAILRLKNVIQGYGADVPSFPKAMYHDIKAHLLFAKAIADDDEIPEWKLRDWMKFELARPKGSTPMWFMLPADKQQALKNAILANQKKVDATKVDRAKFSAAVYKTAKHRYKQLLQNFAGQKWTKKAQADFADEFQ
jgi:outer membrane assembly lipoprotein YfiO